MIGIAEIHGEVMPGRILQNSHIPRAGYSVRELPHNVMAVFVGEAFKVGLKDRVAALPEMIAQGVKRIAAPFGMRALQMLERIDGFDLGQKFMQPGDTALRLRVLSVLDEIRNLILADRTLRHEIALKGRDLEFACA